MLRFLLLLAFLFLPFFPQTAEAYTLAGECTSPYGWRIHPIYGYPQGHAGIDVGVDMDTVVPSATSGTVTDYWGNQDPGGYGIVVAVEADDGSGRYRPVSLSDKAESRKDTLKYPRQEKFASGIVIDVNTADTSVLKKIPGIGSVISRNVVDYRERLGGFHDIDQLLEVKYVDTVLLKWFDVKTGVYRKINVNSAGIDELRKHPYMDFYKARAIVEYRRKRGKIKSLSQISMFKEFSDSDIDRLKHYMSFD